MATDLINKIVDEQAIKAQLETLENGLININNRLGLCAVSAKEFYDQISNAKGAKELRDIISQYNKSLSDNEKVQQQVAKAEKERASVQLQLQKIQTELAKAEQLAAAAALTNQKAQESAAKTELVRQTAIQNTQKVQDQKIAAEQRAHTAAQKTIQAEQAIIQAENTLIATLLNAGIAVDKINLSKREASTINILSTQYDMNEVGSKQQLAAQYGINMIALNKLSGEQRNNTAEGKALEKETMSLSEQMFAMAASTSRATKIYDNNSKQLNMVSINMSQIMRELPNFAISANIGIMSLSNNIPMLADSIKALNLRNKELQSQGIATESTLKTLAKSVISWNGAISIGVALLTAYGPEIIKWASDLLSANKAVDETKVKQDVLNDSVKDSTQHYADQVTNIKKVITSFDSWRKGIISEREALATYNSELGTAFGKTSELDVAIKRVADGSKGYVNALRDMAIADAFYSKMKDSAKTVAEEQSKTMTQWGAIWARISRSTIQNDKSDAQLFQENQDKKVDKAKATMNIMGKYYQQYTQMAQDEAKKAGVSISGQASEDQKQQLKLLENEKQIKLDRLKADSNYDNLNITQKLAFDSKYERVQNDFDKKILLMKYQNGEIDRDQFLTNLIQLTAGQEQFNSQMVAKWHDYYIQIAQAKNQANLEQKKADTDYNTMTFEQKRTFDAEYFAEDEKGKKSILQMQLSYGKITRQQFDIDMAKLNAGHKSFISEQAQLWREYYVKQLEDQQSFEESKIKAGENYSNKDVAYQQQIATQILDIQQNLERQILDYKLKYNQIDDTQYQTAINKMKAAKDQLLQSQKEENQSNDLTQSKINIDQWTAWKIDAQAKLYSEGEISYQEYENSIQAIQETSSLQQLQNEIDKNKKILEADDKLTADKKMGAEQRNAIEASSAEKQAEIDKALADKKLAVQKELNSRLEELVSQFITSVTEIGDNYYQSELDRIDALKTANSDAADAKKTAVEDAESSGVLSAEEADAKKRSIDDQKTLRDKQLSEQATKLKIQQAKFEKAAAILEIGVETAKAVMKIQAEAAVLRSNPLTLPFAAMAMAQIPLVIATGALQAAVILAKPLPTYAKGTEDHPGGAALVGDAYRHELAITPDGTIIKTPDVPTVVDMPRHTMVLPDFDKGMEIMYALSLRSMKPMGMIGSDPSFNDSRLVKKFDEMMIQQERQISRLERLERQLGNISITNKLLKKGIRNNQNKQW